jgi:hypothetical protein
MELITYEKNNKLIVLTMKNIVLDYFIIATIILTKCHDKIEIFPYKF